MGYIKPITEYDLQTLLNEAIDVRDANGKSLKPQDVSSLPIYLRNKGPAQIVTRDHKNYFNLLLQIKYRNLCEDEKEDLAEMSWLQAKIMKWFIPRYGKEYTKERIDFWLG